MLVALLIVPLAVPALASSVEGSDVMYIGGSVSDVKEGTVGRLDLTAAQALVFEHGDSRVAIPYATIQRFQYSQRLARRLGVAATIAVVLVKHRQRRHVVELYFQDSNGVSQVAMFELSKDRAAPVVAVLNARVPPRPAPRSGTAPGAAVTAPGAAVMAPGTRATGPGPGVTAPGPGVTASGTGVRP
jgi:hypothetical protein